jgi:hypothetical protein
VQRYEKELKDSAFTAEFCTGNIVMYGKYNVAIKLDKIYTVYQNVTDVDEIDVVKSVIGKKRRSYEKESNINFNDHCFGFVLIAVRLR